jgi:hypothetical protein
LDSQPDLSINEKPKTMKQLTLLLFLFTLLTGMPSAFAIDPPASPEQLRAAVESALKMKDTNALAELVNWQGASDDMKSLTRRVIEDLFANPYSTVKLIGLPDGFRAVTERDGIRYSPNVSVVGMLEVDFTGVIWRMKLPYGKKGGGFYIPCTVEEKIPGPAIKSRSLAIIVTGSTAPDAQKLSGSFIYIQGGGEVKEAIDGKGNFNKSFWGEYIKSCTVQKTSSDDDPIQLAIIEDGKTIFQSAEVTNNEPIVYKR